MKPADVITFGESLAVLNSRPGRPLQWGDSLEATFAGAESNVAIGLARLGHAVRFHSVLGEDRFGLLIRQSLLAEAIDVTGVTFTGAHPTALMTKLYRITAEPSVNYYRANSAFAQVGPATIDLATVDRARVFYFTGITPALHPQWAARCLELAMEARRGGLSVWFDPNYRRKLWNETQAANWYEKVLPLLDVLLCGLGEGRLITGETTPDAVAARLRTKTSADIVIKDGSRGATAFTADGRHHVPSLPMVAPLDPIGAGDGFSAGYLSAWLDGANPEDRLSRGHALGSLVCLTRGDWEGLPNRAELAAFLGENRESDR